MNCQDTCVDKRQELRKLLDYCARPVKYAEAPDSNIYSPDALTGDDPAQRPTDQLSELNQLQQQFDERLEAVRDFLNCTP